MPKRGGSKGAPSLHDLTGEFLRAEDAVGLADELFRANDRASALVAAEMVNSALVGAIVARLAQMSNNDLERLFFKQGAVLSSFSARIEIGRAIGIYNDGFKALLDDIRKVRNVFAHAIRPLTFAHELVVKACDRFPDPGPSDPAHELHPTRDRYVVVCIRAMMTLAAHSSPQHADIDITDLDETLGPSREK